MFTGELLGTTDKVLTDNPCWTGVPSGGSSDTLLIHATEIEAEHQHLRATWPLRDLLVFSINLLASFEKYSNLISCVTSDLSSLLDSEYKEKLNRVQWETK